MSDPELEEDFTAVYTEMCERGKRIEEMEASIMEKITATDISDIVETFKKENPTVSDVSILHLLKGALNAKS